MHPVFRWGIFLAAIAAGIGFWLTRPAPLAGDQLAAVAAAPADAERGEMVFWAAGCASCHIAPGTEKTDSPVLSGGMAFATQFGTFYAPNISSDPDVGIGGWTLEAFANAVQAGVTPEGSHYYPAFPYDAYAHATPEDIAALYAYMKTLPADQTASRPHDVGFPFNIRRSLGGWKFLFLSDTFVASAETEQLERGRYLVEGLGHCTECHTPRNALGGLQTTQWMSGAPNPSGEGRIPNITDGALHWSEGEIAEYLKSGFTPDFDTAGGTMAAVVRNTAKLSDADRAAIASYLKAIPAIANEAP